MFLLISTFIFLKKNAEVEGKQINCPASGMYEYGLTSLLLTSPMAAEKKMRPKKQVVNL